MPSPAELACLDCGVELIRKAPVGRLPKHCGRCRLARRNARQRARRLVKEPNERRCSTEGCGRPHVAKGLCGTCYQVAARAAGGRGYTRYDRTCERCARPFQTTTAATRFCSLRCGQWARHGRTGVDAIEPWRPPPTPPRPAPRPRLFVGVTCVCGAPFLALGGERSCSSACAAERKRRNRAASQQRRRARLAGVPSEWVQPWVVFARDDWTCWLCLEPLDRQGRVPEPFAPTLDHVIPLADMGPHTYANLRAAHFICNSHKRDLSIAEMVSDGF